MKDLNEFTKKDFENLPYFDSVGMLVKCDSVVLLPTKRVHDSGFRYFEAIPCKGAEPLGRLHGYDIFTIYNPKTYRFGTKIDCLKKSKLMRVILPNDRYYVDTLCIRADERGYKNDI